MLIPAVISFIRSFYFAPAVSSQQAVEIHTELDSKAAKHRQLPES